MENEILDKLSTLGIDKTEVSTADLHKLMQGKISGMLNFSVPNSEKVRDFLDKENVQYSVENDKIKFSGKVKPETINEADDNEKNRKILDEANVSYQAVPEKQRLRWVGSNAAILAIGAINPIVGIIAFTYNTLRLIAKKRNIENSYNLSNPDLDRLKQGKLVMGTDNFGRSVLRQLDKDTNIIMSIKVDNIKIPDKIYDTELTQRQKSALKTGQTITVKDELGNDRKIRLDLVNGTGLVQLKQFGKKIEVEKERIGFKL